MTTIIKDRKIIDREIRLVKTLGEGTFGEVHVAEPIRSRKRSTFCYPKQLAVKILHKNVCGADEATALCKELEALQRLQHPCIVAYLGVWREASVFGKYSGCHCLAMGYCDGGDMDAFIRETVKQKVTVSAAVVVRLMACVFAGLNYSHAHRIIHRDIKPANVFFTLKANADTSKDLGACLDRALIGDYGLARPLDRTMQLVKTRVGTPCYCSPEIVAGEVYSSKTDIFSAGVMFYELMAQCSPFWRRNVTEVQCFYRIIHHDPLPRFRELCANRYSASLIDVVCQCLSKTEAERPSAYEVLTRFSARIPRQLADMRIPLYSDKPAAPAAQAAAGAAGAATATPAKDANAAAGGEVPTTVAEKWTVPASPAAASTPKSPQQRAPPAPAHAGESPAARLCTLLAREFPSALDAPLRAAARGNIPLFLLLKVLLLTRCSAAASATVPAHGQGSLVDGFAESVDIESAVRSLVMGVCGPATTDSSTTSATTTADISALVSIVQAAWQLPRTADS